MAVNWMGIKQPGQFWQASQHFWTFGNMVPGLSSNWVRGPLNLSPLQDLTDQADVEMPGSDFWRQVPETVLLGILSCHVTSAATQRPPCCMKPGSTERSWRTGNNTGERKTAKEHQGWGHVMEEATSEAAPPVQLPQLRPCGLQMNLQVHLEILTNTCVSN